MELKYQTRSEEAGMLEERYTYTVVPRRPIRGLVKGKVLTRSIVLSLTKDEVLYCLKYANVYRKFFPTSKQERVTPKTLDRLHRSEYMSEAQYNALNNETEDVPEVSEPQEESNEVVEDTPIIENEIEEEVETPTEEEVIESEDEVVEDIIEEDQVEEELKKEEEEQSHTEYDESESASTEESNDSVEEMTEYSVSTDNDVPVPEVTNTTATYTGYTSKSSRKKKKHRQYSNYNNQNTTEVSSNTVPEESSDNE